MDESFEYIGDIEEVKQAPLNGGEEEESTQKKDLNSLSSISVENDVDGGSL